MRYIVLDTNCLLQALPSNSPYHKIWTEVLDGNISLCVNTDILEEYEEVIARKATPEIAQNNLRFYVKSSVQHNKSCPVIGIVEPRRDTAKKQMWLHRPLAARRNNIP